MRALHDVDGLRRDGGDGTRDSTREHRLRRQQRRVARLVALQRALDRAKNREADRIRRGAFRDRGQHPAEEATGDAVLGVDHLNRVEKALGISSAPAGSGRESS